MSHPRRCNCRHGHRHGRGGHGRALTMPLALLVAVAVIGVGHGISHGGGESSGSGSLSTSRIDHLMLQAGFPRSQLATGEAIVHAESSGHPDATNSNSNGTTDYGLWQINSVHSDLLGANDWRDPLANTRMAYTVWKHNGWDAWSTWPLG